MQRRRGEERRERREDGNSRCNPAFAERKQEEDQEKRETYWIKKGRVADG